MFKISTNCLIIVADQTILEYLAAPTFWVTPWILGGQRAQQSIKRGRYAPHWPLMSGLRICLRTIPRVKAAIMLRIRLQISCNLWVECFFSQILWVWINLTKPQDDQKVPKTKVTFKKLKALSEAAAAMLFQRKIFLH